MDAKKKKRLKIILGSTAAVLVVAIIVILLTLGSIVKTAIQTVGPKILGVPVTVSSVTINLFSGSFSIHNLFVGNPAGYKNDKALTVKTLRVKIVPSSLTAKKLIVNEFTLDGVDVYFEPSSNLLSNNLSQLNKNIQTFAGTSAQTEDKAQKDEKTQKDEKAPQKPAEPKRLQIDKLSLTNIYVDIVASIPGTTSTSAPLPVVPIVLENIGQDEAGVTALDVTAAVLNKLTLGVFQSVGDAFPSMKSITDAGQQILNSTTDALKGLQNILHFGNSAKK